MSEAAKKWVGQIVDGKYPLREYLGGSDHSAVFLTEYNSGESQKAAIKLVAADKSAEQQLATWEFAAQLSHPNLLKLYGTGRCALLGNDLLFLVMEHAEENLSDILPQRALRPDETRDMLCPVLDALEYLHGKGLVHGDLKPANILASGDNLKISSDTIVRAGEALATPRKAGPYDPPEAISDVLTPAADVWSLGTTLVEVLTQRLPEWQPGPQREPMVPVNLPAPFQEIARQCLRLEPQRRASVADIAAKMNARAAVTTATSSAVSTAGMAPPGNLPSPSENRVRVQSFAVSPKSIAAVAMPSRDPVRLKTNSNRNFPYKDPGAKSRFIVPLTVGALIFAAILTVPRLLTNRTESHYAAKVAPSKPAAHSAGESAPPSVALPKTKATRERNSKEAASEGARNSARTERAATAPPPPKADALKTASDKITRTAEGSSGASSNSADTAKQPAGGGSITSAGAVLDQVLPDVSPKARATIRGRVRVGIKLQVDAAGAVSGAELDSPGPSKFFADLALKAGREWVFTPPEVNGRSVPSEWILRFVFTQGDTKVTPSRINP